MDLTIGLYRFITNGYLADILFGILFLLFAFHLYRQRGSNQRHFGKRLFLGFLIVIALQLLFVFADTWYEWHKSGCGLACQFFFPPYSHYYFNEVIVRWTSTFAFNAVVGLIGGLIFSGFVRLTNGRFIDQLDVDILTVGGMIAGWPNILIFYGLVFLMTICVTFVRAMVERSAGVRMIITPVLPLAAALIAVFGDLIARWVGLYEIGLTIV